MSLTREPRLVEEKTSTTGLRFFIGRVCFVFRSARPICVSDFYGERGKRKENEYSSFARTGDPEIKLNSRTKRKKQEKAD